MGRRRFLTAREQHEMLSPWRRTATPGGVPDDGKLPLQWKSVPHLPELWPGREAFRAEPGNHYTYFLDSPYGDFNPANPHWSWPNMWKLNHYGPDGDGEWYNSPTSYHATRDEAIQAAAAHHVLGRDPLDHPGARRGEDYAITPEQDRAAKEYTHNLLNPPGAVDEDLEWDDEDEDDGPPAPPGVWTPPRYDEDGNYGPTGEMYGTHDERYLEDIFHGHLVDLTDQESIDSYEHQRTKPKFKGSGLEDTMWTNIANRYEGSGEHDDVNEEGDEDFGHPKIVDYFNKVHGCDEHLFTPPDRHEPHGNFGEHPEGWDPDDQQDPFDPRIIGASRTAARRYSGGMDAPEPLDWRESQVDEPGTYYKARGTNNDRSYDVVAPFDDKPDYPDMWTVMHSGGSSGEPLNVSYHPSREHAFQAAEAHHATGADPAAAPGAQSRPAKQSIENGDLWSPPTDEPDLEWEQRGVPIDTEYTAYGNGSHEYTVLAPGHHEQKPMNGFGERIQSEHPEMWALAHRFEPLVGWEHEVTYHPTREHAMEAARRHHLTGMAPGRHPGAIPGTDYDEERVEAWDDIAEELESEWEEQNIIPEDLRSQPEYPDYDKRNKGLKWSYENKYWDDEPSYGGADGDSHRPHYTITGPHHDRPHPYGPYQLRWSEPGFTGGPDEEQYEFPHGGASRHQSIEEAMEEAERHNSGHPTARPMSVPEMLRALGVGEEPDNSYDLDEMWERGQNWNPDDVDPNDPRIKGASRDGD